MARERGIISKSKKAQQWMREKVKQILQKHPEWLYE